MSAPLLSFPPYVLDQENACLWQEKKRIDLMPRDFAVLHHLVSRPDQLVTHEELLKTIWTNTVVSPGVLKVCIRRIRRILHDEAESPQFIATVHRRGYRFIGKVVSSQHSVASSFFASDKTSQLSVFRTSDFLDSGL